MNEDSLNIQIRQYLKKLGINSQRTLEQAIRDGIENGTITDTDQINIQMTLSVPQLNINQHIEGQLNLEP